MSLRNKYETELGLVFGKLVEMCRAAERAIDASVKAFLSRDKEAAKKVMENDRAIDLKEREIEQDCLKILLMEHPVAGDFRDVSAALKVITDLERIGDQAADISEIALRLEDELFSFVPEAIESMASAVTAMVKDGVDSYINKDYALARDLDRRDDRVDNLFIKVKDELIATVKSHPDAAEEVVMYLMIAKYLERIGDHAVNIGEWAEYALTGVHSNEEIKR